MPNQTLTETELQQTLTELSTWHVETWFRPDAFHERMELVKSFTFRDYTAAIEFLASTTPHINALDHHPRWEVDWKTLVVRTCTHDAACRITHRDIKLAKLIDKLYAEQLNS